MSSVAIASANIDDVSVKGSWNSSNMLASVDPSTDTVVGLPVLGSGVQVDGVSGGDTLASSIDDTGGAGPFTGAIGNITIGKGVTARLGRAYVIASESIGPNVNSMNNSTAVPHTTGTPAAPWNMVNRPVNGAPGTFQDDTNAIPDIDAVLLYLVV
jgi:hypothetical protein